MIQEILSNSILVKFNREFVRIENFTPEEKSIASKKAEDVYNDFFESGVYINEEIQDILESNGYWTDDDAFMVEKLNEDIDTIRIDYFDNFFFNSKKEFLKKALLEKQSLLNSFLLKRSYLSEYTCESAKNEAYYHFLFEKYQYGYHLSKLYLLSILTEQQVRSLYFENAWRLIWSATKDPMAIFGCTANHLNENQIHLIYWSKMYDSIYESYEPPPFQIMEDHDAVDGYFAKQRQKRKSEEKIKHIAGDNKHPEVFKPVRNKQEQKEILDLNNKEVKGIIKSKAKELKEHGEMSDLDFSHVKRDIATQINGRKK